MSEEKLNDTNTISEENTDQENTPEVDVDAIIAENKKLQSIIKRKNEKLAQATQDDEDDKPIIKKETSQDGDKYERLELKIEGYSDEIIDQIMEYGGKKFLNTDLGKTAVEQLVKQQKAKEATDIDSSIKSQTGKTLTPDDLANMSSAEMEKHLPKS